MTASLDDINEIVPYSVQHRPERLSDTFSGFISLSSDDIQSYDPARIDVIVATPATRWSAAGHSVTLFTFARFRKYFTIIEDLAPSLAHVYLRLFLGPFREGKEIPFPRLAVIW